MTKEYSSIQKIMDLAPANKFAEILIMTVGDKLEMFDAIYRVNASIIIFQDKVDTFSYFRISEPFEWVRYHSVKMITLTEGKAWIIEKDDVLVIGPRGMSDPLLFEFQKTFSEVAYVLKPWVKTSYWRDYRMGLEKIEIFKN